jgi:hypothetical protein
VSMNVQIASASSKPARKNIISSPRTACAVSYVSTRSGKANYHKNVISILVEVGRTSVLPKTTLQFKPRGLEYVRKFS